MQERLARALRLITGAGDQPSSDSCQARQGLWPQDAVIFSVPPAPGVLRAGAGAVFAALHITALVAGAGSILHDSPERSEIPSGARGGFSSVPRSNVLRRPAGFCSRRALSLSRQSASLSGTSFAG